MFRRIVVLAVALSMGALTGACTGSVQPSPTPTPSPTFACIPEAGGDPVPCGPIEALHRSEWIRGLNPPASSRHLAT